jgi:hypothetical protein
MVDDALCQQLSAIVLNVSYIATASTPPTLVTLLLLLLLQSQPTTWIWTL